MAARNNVVLEVFDTDREWVTSTLIPQIQAEVGIKPTRPEAFAMLRRCWEAIHPQDTE
jgi:hypothetical protein